MSVDHVRCSSLARPMHCRGSLFFSLPEEESGEAAKQGTACAEYLEKLIKGEPIGNQATNGVVFDEDMKFYSEAILADMKRRAVGPINSETKVAWMTQAGIRIQGSYDASYVDAEGTLHVEDLKYGWKIVEAKENWQLLGYAIGEMFRRQQGFDQITMTIQQPRPHHELGSVRSWTIGYNELLQYKAQIEEMAAKVAAGDKTLQTGDHCKYCKAAGHCPALNRSFYAGIEYAHDFYQDEIDEKELSAQLDLANRVAEVIKIKQDSLKALVIDRIRAGKIVPNYVLEASYGDRVWKAGVSAKTIGQMVDKQVTETKLLSPAKLEKLGVDRSLIAALVERPFIGQKAIRKDTTEIGNNIFGASAPTKGN